MNEEAIEDLKQFILNTVIQYTSDLVTKDDLKRSNLVTKDSLRRVNLRLKRLEGNVDHIVEAIDNTVIPYMSLVDDQVQEHDKILKRLQHKAA